MILVYTLSFSILITSVIKVTGVFISLDRELAAKRSEFVKKTRATHRNDKGNITLMAILLTLMVSALMMFFTVKDKVELDEARYRKDSYLCFEYLNNQTEFYIDDMSKFNALLRTLYSAMFAPHATAAAKAAFDTAVITRNARHFYYVKNLLKNKWCKDASESASYIKNFPYEINLAFILQTNIDETTKLKAEKWTVTHYKKPNGIRLKNSFCLKADMSAKGVIFPDFRIKTAEVAMGDFSKLKCLSGFL